jgi:hypothetical protein
VGKTNVTLSLDADLLRRARIRALEAGTTVNDLIRRRLEAFVGEEAGGAIERFFAAADATKASSGRRGRTWTRDEIHDRG